MAYTPKTWACGEKITAEKLNNLESGVASINSEYVPKEWNCGEKITAEALNHIEQGIADAECEPCRILLFDNTVNFSQDAGDWLVKTGPMSGQYFDAKFEATFPGTWTLIVDDEQITENIKGNHQSGFYIGVLNPSSPTGEYKIGCCFACGSGDYSETILSAYMITLDKSYFSIGDHSIKIYKNLDA